MLSIEVVKSILLNGVKYRSNVIFSPISMEMVLGMAAAGCDEEGRAALAKYGDFQNHPMEGAGCWNGLLCNEICEVSDDYRQQLAGFNAQIIHGGDRSEMAELANSMIESATNGLITEVVDAELLSDPDWKATLINALSIVEKWQMPFDLENSFEENFFREDGAKLDKKVWQMRQTDDFSYAEQSGEFQSILLSTEGRREVQIVLPAKGVSLQTLISEKFEDLVKLQHDGWKKKVYLKMPRIKIENTIDLKQVLEIDKLLMSGLGLLEEVPVLMRQIAKLEAEETGVKAAAVTEMMCLSASSADDDDLPIEMIVDRPFLALIREPRRAKRVVSFVAVVFNP